MALLTTLAILIQVHLSQSFQDGELYFDFSPEILSSLSSWFQLLALTDHALTDNEYRYNMGDGYVFFEVLHPEDLSYTYKINPAAFSQPWNMSLTEYKMILADPPCGCASFRNADEVEGQIVFIGEETYREKSDGVLTKLYLGLFRTWRLFFCIQDNQSSRSWSFSSNNFRHRWEKWRTLCFYGGWYHWKNCQDSLRLSLGKKWVIILNSFLFHRQPPHNFSQSLCRRKQTLYIIIHWIVHQKNQVLCFMYISKF